MKIVHVVDNLVDLGYKLSRTLNLKSHIAMIYRRAFKFCNK